MDIRTDIICSECDVDLKDKVAMGETELPNQPNTNVIDIKSQSNIDEKTLADLIKNSEDAMKGCSITGIVSVTPVGLPTHLITMPSKYVSYSEVLGQEWVIPSESVLKEISDGNEIGYVYLDTACGILVLCEVVKDVYNDTSGKIRSIPVNKNNLRRMK